MVYAKSQDNSTKIDMYATILREKCMMIIILKNYKKISPFKQQHLILKFICVNEFGFEIKKYHKISIIIISFFYFSISIELHLYHNIIIKIKKDYI